MMLEHIKSKRLTIGEVLSIATDIYKQNIRTILFVGFFIIVPLFLFNQWILAQTVINLDYLYNDVIDIDMTAEVNAMTSASLYNMVASLVQMVVQPLASIAMIWGAVNIIKGLKSNAKNSFLYSFSKAPAAIWTTFLQVVFLFVIIFSFLLLALSCFTVVSEVMAMATIFIFVIICGILIAYFTTTWIFADCVVAIQNISGLKALIASKRAVKIHFWETFLYIILYGVITFLLGMGVGNVLANMPVSDEVYIICYAIWNFLRYVMFDGFFTMILVVLFLNRVWENVGNATNIYEIKEETTPQTEQQNTITLQKEEITEKQMTDDLEKMPKIEQQNKVDLEKTSEQKSEQEPSENNDIEKH